MYGRYVSRSILVVYGGVGAFNSLHSGARFSDVPCRTAASK